MNLIDTNLSVGTPIDYDVLRDNSLFFDYSALGEYEDSFRQFINDEIEADEIVGCTVDTLTYAILNASSAALSYTDSELAGYGYTFTWDQIKAKMQLQPVVIVPTGYTVDWYNRGAGLPISSGITEKNITYNDQECIAYYITAGVHLINQVDGDGYKLTITVVEKTI